MHFESSADTWRALKWQKRELRLLEKRERKRESWRTLRWLVCIHHIFIYISLQLFYNPMHVRWFNACLSSSFCCRSIAIVFILLHGCNLVHWCMYAYHENVSVRHLHCHFNCWLIVTLHLLSFSSGAFYAIVGVGVEISGDTSTFLMQMLCMRSDYSMFNWSEWEILRIISSASLCTFASQIYTYTQKTLLCEWDFCRSSVSFPLLRSIKEHFFLTCNERCWLRYIRAITW